MKTINIIDNKFYSHNNRELKLFHFKYSELDDYDKVWVEFLKEIGYNSDKVYLEKHKDNCADVYVYADNSYIEQYAIVKLKEEHFKYFPQFKKDQHLIYLGEVPNMHGHCLISDFKTGKIQGCYHIEDFEVVNDL